MGYSKFFISFLLLIFTRSITCSFFGNIFGFKKEDNNYWKTLDGKATVLFGHRGEKILVPQHTLAGYEIAAILGADYIEPDLVMTKDNILVCHHDIFLKDDTDVESHSEFKERKKNYTGIIDNENQTILNDWFIQDFTLTELKTLRLKQENIGIRPQYFNYLFQIPTFQEYLNVIHKMTFKLNRTIGIIPELKSALYHNRFHSQYFMENRFLEVLYENGYPIHSNDPSYCKYMEELIKCPPVIIQNFEKFSLEYIRTKTDLDLMILVMADLTLLTYKGMKDISKIANYYCTWKEYLYGGVEAELRYTGVEYDKEVIKNLGGFILPKEFVNEAHHLGMKMGIFTIYDSREPSLRGCAIVPGCEPENKTEELFYFFKLGVDGIFIENMAESREIRMKFSPKSG